MQEKRRDVAQKRRSYFLLEILVAMALFALVVVPLLTMNWGILGAEMAEKKAFRLEQEVKHHAISTLETLYSGQYPKKTLMEGVPLPPFEGAMQLDEGVLTLTYILPKGTTREFTILTTPKKSP